MQKLASRQIHAKNASSDPQSLHRPARAPLTIPTLSERGPCSVIYTEPKKKQEQKILKSILKATQ